MRLTKHQKQSITSRLRKQKNLSAALLFGSQAHGITGPMSDVDIACVFAPQTSALQRERTMRHLYADLAEPLRTDAIDLVDTTEAPPLLRHRALIGSVPLFVRHKNVFHKAMIEAVRDLEDFRPHLEVQQRLIKRKLS
ncbi:nucleotidyltransferase domain-containing protein [Candidatus Uhrbacteria bacterium]|nr:nucleotidyltransferase domain-containing protein [Candidatus Uhrbacteria bacterium]